jgi:hypothetical protein
MRECTHYSTRNVKSTLSPTVKRPGSTVTSSLRLLQSTCQDIGRPVTSLPDTISRRVTIELRAVLTPGGRIEVVDAEREHLHVADGHNERINIRQVLPR